MSIQQHGTNLWTEPAANGGTPTVLTWSFVKSGSNWVFQQTIHEEVALLLVGSHYMPIDLTPVAGDYYDGEGNVQTVDLGDRLYAVGMRDRVTFY